MSEVLPRWVPQTWLKTLRGRVERRIGLFDAQFNGGSVRCRSTKRHTARRWTKAPAHNCSRHVDTVRQMPEECCARFRLAA